ncbi:hypothetical protein [Paracoccus methylarcula]|uniref:Uncharacterized protein n=1 Tax=Paracoccus methylarcula TaxID=72022 RepID=A0A3R7PP16_9RHOB|nr:hypothetical protein [Paracoccus methylarcula]RNF33871.1 hypothetical protein A7A09_013145 [Paracoccus methylarcula]
MPEDKISAARRDFSKGMANSATDGLAPLFGAGGIAADIMPFNEIDLHNWLHAKVAIADHARHRARWFGGRWYNCMISEDPDRISVSGARLRQLLALLEQEPPAQVASRSYYPLRIEHARKCLAVLRDRLQRTGPKGQA